MKRRPTALLLHGWCSDGGGKEMLLRCMGLTVVKPKLNNWSFRRAVSQAQQAFDLHRPDMVVGSSRGAAVAMNIESDGIPLVLLCPPWKRFGRANGLGGNAIVIHGLRDSLVPLEDSIELCRRSNRATLLAVNDDHRLNGWQGQQALRLAVAALTGGTHGGSQAANGEGWAMPGTEFHRNASRLPVYSLGGTTT